MKFVALLTNPQDEIERWERMSPEEQSAEREKEVPRWDAVMAELGAAGKIVSGAELALPSKAKTVRVRNGETVVTDGPFAETKEVVGGFFVLECDDLDEALAIAARIPVAETGSVEVRPLYEQ